MIMRMMAVYLPNEKNETITELYKQAECLYDVGNDKKAFTVYKQLLELDPQDALAHFNIAMMRYDSRVDIDSLSKDEADKHFASAYQLFFASAVNENNARSQMALGKIFSQKSRLEDKQALDMDDFRYDKNLCAAAYWYDRAAEQGVYGASYACAKTLDSFDNDYLGTELSDAAFIISRWCKNQNPYIPVDPERAEHWYEIARKDRELMDARYGPH